MNYVRQITLLISVVWLLTGCRTAQNNAPAYSTQTVAHMLPYDAGVDQCYGLTADDIPPILGEAVNYHFISDYEQGHCFFTSVAASRLAWGSGEQLTIYGPAQEQQYVAIAVRPSDSQAEAEFTDPMDYGVGKPLLTLTAELFDDPARYEQFWSNFDLRTADGTPKNPAPILSALAELTTTQSLSTTLQLHFLPNAGDGAIWYWQATNSGHHLAGIYVFINGEQIMLQALVASGQSEAETQAHMLALVEQIHALGKTAPETRSYLNYNPFPKPIGK